MQNKSQKYEVVLRNTISDNRWSMFQYGTSFADAERQAQNTLTTTNQQHEEIISIYKDYDELIIKGR